MIEYCYEYKIYYALVVYLYNVIVLPSVTYFLNDILPVKQEIIFLIFMVLLRIANLKAIYFRIFIKQRSWLVPSGLISGALPLRVVSSYIII